MHLTHCRGSRGGVVNRVAYIATKLAVSAIVQTANTVEYLGCESDITRTQTLIENRTTLIERVLFELLSADDNSILLRIMHSAISAIDQVHDEEVAANASEANAPGTEGMLS